MNVRNAFVPTLMTLGLIACASTTPLRETASEQAPLVVQIAYVNHRATELEPCGCSTNPEGGLEREAEMYRKTGFEGLKVSGGITFVPVPEQFNAQLKGHYQRKAEFMVEGLNLLGTTVLAPSAEDSIFGVSSLMKLSEKAKFPFISANLVDKKTGKRLFPAYWEKQAGEALLTFIGIAAPTYIGYPVPEEIELKDPAAALKETLASLPPESLSKRIFFVVTSLPAHRQKELQQNVGRIHFYLGGDLVESDSGFAQERPGTVWTNPRNGGREVSILKLTAKVPALFLRSEQVAKNFGALVASKTEEITQLTKKIASTKVGKKEKQRLQTLQTSLQNELPRLETMAMPASSNATPYEGVSLILGSDYESKSGPLAPLLDRYRDAVRTAALGEL